MIQESVRYKALFVISLLGLLVAVFAGLSERIHWLQSFCAGITGACKDTAAYTLLRTPLWIWGAVFFVLLMLSVLRLRKWLFWLVAGAVGAEVTFLWIMISTNFICVFCVANLLVVLLLAVLAFDKIHFWQILSVSLLAFLFTFLIIPRENELLAAAWKQEHNEVIAEVGDEDITQNQLDGSLRQRLYDLESQIYQLKRQQLDQMILDKVLEKEAGRRGITAQQLVNDEVLSKAGPMSDREVNQYIQANPNLRDEWKGTEAELMNRVRPLLTRQRDYRKIVEFGKSLEQKYHVAIYLKEPVPPFSRIKTEGSPTLGPADAPITVIEFSDYECPACRNAHSVVKNIRDLYKGKLRWIFMDFPLKIHKEAELAAEAAQCAAEQSKFWEYQDVLYESREPLTVEYLRRSADQLELDTGRFNQCVESGKYKRRIQKEVEEARKIGIERTPSFIVNGKLVIGALSLERFKEGIEAELKAAKGQ